jgi:tetratricopeptide (TPR) repeat protein
MFLLAKALRRAPAMAFLGLSFFIHLSPHSSVAPLAEMHNEHRPYLALIGPALIVCTGISLLLERLVDHPAPAQAIVTVALMASLGSMTFVRNRVWENDLTFWTDVVEKAPRSSRGQMNLGLALMSRGRIAEAEERFRETIRIAPSYALGYVNLAIALGHRGDLSAARTAYDQAIRVDPKESHGYYWRGLFRAQRGELDAAVEDFELALKRDDRSIRVLLALTETLMKLGRREEARTHAEYGLQISPVEFRPLLSRLKPGSK